MWWFRYCFSRLDKKNKATKNSKNIDNKCFKYELTVALNYEEIKWNPERVSNIKPCLNKYNWKGINYPSKIDDWKNNQQLPLILCILKKKKYVQLISQNLI